MLFSAQQFIIAILHYFVKAQFLRFRPWRADFLRLSNAGAGGRILSERMGGDSRAKSDFQPERHAAGIFDDGRGRAVAAVGLFAQGVLQGGGQADF